MKLFGTISQSAALVHLVAAIQTRAAQDTAEEIILSIMPEAASCDADSSECRTAGQAAPYLIDAFQKYGVFRPAAIAAVLATIGTESVDLKYKTNQNPGRPGQGTSNMQMYKFNYEFAQTIEELREPLSKIDGAGDESPTAETMNAVLELVISDNYNFQTGPWFFSTHCTDAQKDAFASNDLDKAFEEYSLTCIGAGSLDDGRGDRWSKAKAAFKL